ncbi:MAG: hypothetical protein IKE51_02500 [Solobacterium sp.]|nr:hypothetical protein [Solobacterium sp.]
MISNEPKKRKLRLKASIVRFSRKTLLIIFTGVLTAIVFGYCALYIVLKGPSPTFSNYVISTLMETRRGKAIVHHFFTDEEIQTVLQKTVLRIQKKSLLIMKKTL